MSDSSNEVEVHDERGRLTGRFELADGQLHGKSTIYGRDHVLAHINYARGQRHGEMRSYGEQGQLSSIVPHADGFPHGEATYFYPDGSLARAAQFKQGRLHGVVRDFAPDGKQIACDTYVDGEKQDASAKPPAAAATDADGVKRRSWLTRLVEG